MSVGVITGSGTYTLPGFEAAAPERFATRFGETLVTRGSIGEVEVLHLSRHGEGHKRLSNHVNHKANVMTLKELGVECVLAVTVCGAVDPSVPLGSLIAFDDLHFGVNRLADGSLCTLYDTPGDPLRGHWIYESPFSAGVRAAMLAGCRDAGLPVRDGGCYGHVDGPRFNTPAEIRSLALAGVTAVSQTAGPETVLCGEAELAYALLGYATDYANGVKEQPTSVAELLRRHGSLEGTIAGALRERSPRVRGALRDEADVLRDFKEIATLRRAKGVRRPPDRVTDFAGGAGAVRALGMKRLAERLEQLAASARVIGSKTK